MSAQHKNLIASERQGPGDEKTTQVTVEPNDIRMLLALTFSALFFLTVAAAMYVTFRDTSNMAATWTTMKDVLAVLLPAETGLLGSILGFYFGSKGAEDKVLTGHRATPGESPPSPSDQST